jgi:hypothetical protein
MTHSLEVEFQHKEATKYNCSNETLQIISYLGQTFFAKVVFSVSDLEIASESAGGEAAAGEGM